MDSAHKCSGTSGPATAERAFTGNLWLPRADDCDFAPDVFKRLNVNVLVLQPHCLVWARNSMWNVELFGHSATQTLHCQPASSAVQAPIDHKDDAFFLFAMFFDTTCYK